MIRQDLKIQGTWRKVKLGEIANISYGKDLPTSRLKSAGFPVYGGNGLIGYSDEYLFEDPKIIVGCRGAYSGNIFKTKPKSFVTHNSLILDFKDRAIYEPFVFYKLLRSNVKSTVTGSAQPQITITELERLEFTLPSKEDQKRIADILSAFDDKIELNNKISAALEQMAQAIFKEWFVNNIEAPNWQKKNLFHVAEVTYGYPLGSGLFSDKPEGMPLIRIRNLSEGRSSTYTTEKVSDKYLVKNGDILVGMDGEFATVVWTGGEAYLNQRVARLRPKDAIPWYFVLLSTSKRVKDFELAVGGTTVAHLSDKDLRSIEIKVPDDKFLAKIGPTLENLYRRHVSLRLENQKLAALRDLLLPKLMSGEIEV